MDYIEEELLRDLNISSTIVYCHKCALCDFRTNNINNLTRHYTVHINNFYPPTSVEYICGRCNNNFKTKEELLVHSNTHSVLTYQCNICGKKCKSIGGLKSHKTHLHNKMYFKHTMYYK